MVPFLKKDKSGAGYRFIFPKALYSAQALTQLKEIYAEKIVSCATRGRYFDLCLDVASEEDCLEIGQRFLHLSKNAR